MTSPPLSPQPLSPQIGTLIPSLARSFAMILATICAVIACRFRERRLAALIVPLHRRLARISSRFQRLLALLATGRLPQTRPSRPGRGGGPAAQNLLPRGHGWVIRAFGYHAAGMRSQLAHQLAQPAMIELLATVPQASRILAPLCHMLGLTLTGTLATLPARPRPRAWAQPPINQATPPSPHPFPLPHTIPWRDFIARPFRDL